VIVERCGPLSYLVQTLDGRVWKRHVDHVKIGSEDTAVEVKDRGQHDSDQASPVTFQEEPGEMTTTPRNAPPESTSQSGAP